MASIDKSCDILQGFNFKKDKQTTVGFISRMTLGGVELAADFSVRDPMNPAASLSVVAVLSQASWGGGVTDPLSLSGQLSATNRQRVAMLLSIADLPELKVPFAFAVYEYDGVARTYFKCLCSGDAGLQAIVDRTGVLSLAVSADASAEVVSPSNFTFSVGLAPQPIAQSIMRASSVTLSAAKAWGVAPG